VVWDAAGGAAVCVARAGITAWVVVWATPDCVFVALGVRVVDAAVVCAVLLMVVDGVGVFPGWEFPPVPVEQPAATRTAKSAVPHEMRLRHEVT
jgi:hypothetical protein